MSDDEFQKGFERRMDGGPLTQSRMMGEVYRDHLDEQDRKRRQEAMKPFTPAFAGGGGRKSEGSFTGAIAHVAVFLLVVFFCIGLATAGDGPASDGEVGAGLIVGVIAYFVLKAMKIVDLLAGLTKVLIWAGIAMFGFWLLAQMAG